MAARFEIAETSDESPAGAALAHWLTQPENPLTWRSMVNRVWHHHFGRGLVETPNDFGKMGSAPSHAELLDWLAVWFRDEAHGSLKRLHRLIVTSSTTGRLLPEYPMAEGISKPDLGTSRSGTADSLRATAASIDADNRLLWRMNRRASMPSK
jgi:hypothetical protein